MAPRRLSGPVQRGAIKVLLEMGVASTSDIMPYTHATQLNAQYRSRSLCNIHLRRTRRSSSATDPRCSRSHTPSRETG
jgi:hypothetical protein